MLEFRFTFSETAFKVFNRNPNEKSISNSDEILPYIFNEHLTLSKYFIIYDEKKSFKT